VLSSVVLGAVVDPGDDLFDVELRQGWQGATDASITG
jgi:hypothetical protein